MTWINCKLSEFCDIVMGQSPPSTSYNTRGDGLPFFQGKAEFGELYPQIQKYCNKPKKVAERNDTLLSVRAPVGPTNIAIQKSCIGRGLAAIRALDSVNYKYVFYLLRSKQIYLSGRGTGTTFRAITKDFLHDLDIAVSPLPEQAQVISIIEQLFSDLDNAIDNLKKAKDQLKVYRQSVLKYAFEGKLVVVNGEWLETTLSTEFKIVMGQSPESKHYNQKGEGLPFFQGKKEFTKLYAKAEVWSRKVTKVAEKDDVLLSIRAPIGPVNLAPAKCGIGRGLAAIKPNQKTKSKLLLYLLKNIEGELEDRGTGTTFKAITKPRLYSVPIRVPVTKESRKIILQEIESRFSVCDKMEEIITNSLEQAEALRQSILKQAFEGKLTEEWRKNHLDLISGENSAEALLKNIKAEREALGNTRRRKK